MSPPPCRARERGVAVVDVLRDAIRQRLLAPGAPLVQASLATALGVSKIPVREALHSLAAEGLVTFTDEGVRVVSLSPAEVHELWSLRALVEPALAGAIVHNAGPADLRQLRELVDAMDAGRRRRLDATSTSSSTSSCTASPRCPTTRRSRGAC